MSLELAGYIVDVGMDLQNGLEFIYVQEYLWGWSTISIMWIPGLVITAQGMKRKNIFIAILLIILWPAFVPFYL